MEAQQPRARIFGPKFLFHHPGPNSTGGAVFGNLFKEIVVSVEEEAEAGGKVVHVQPALDAPLDVFDAVDQGEGQLLRGSAARFPDVVAADADGIPAREFFGPKFDGVRHQAHTRFGREDVFFLSDVFFEDVVLDGAAQLAAGDAAIVGHGNVHRPDNGRRAVDGHTGGYFIQGKAVQQDFHIAQRGDSHAAFAELAQGFGGVAVVAVEGGHIKGSGEAGLSLLQQVFEAGVGLFGGSKAGEHTHCPQFASIAGGVDAPGKGILAGQVDVFQIVFRGCILRRVQPLDGRGRGSDELVRAFRAALQRFLQRCFFPLFFALPVDL